MSNKKQLNHLDEIIDKYIKGIKSQFSEEYGVKEYICKINFDEIPDGVKYSKVEKYIKDLNVEITPRMFKYYIEQGLMPSPVQKNDKLHLYSKEHVLKYLLIAEYKKHISLDKLTSYFNSIQPYIEKEGIANFAKEYFELENQINEQVFILINELTRNLINDLIETDEKDSNEEEKREDIKSDMKIIMSEVIFLMGKSMINIFDVLLNKDINGEIVDN